MKKQILRLLVVTSFVAYSNAAYQSHPEQFKQVVTALSSTPVGGQVKKSVVGSYRQILDVMMNTRALCKQKPGDIASIRADFEKPAKSFLKNMESRVAKFKTMNAEALLTPLQGVLSEVVSSSQKDFVSKLDWAIKEMQMYVSVVA